MPGKKVVGLDVSFGTLTSHHHPSILPTHATPCPLVLTQLCSCPRRRAPKRAVRGGASPQLLAAARSLFPRSPLLSGGGLCGARGTASLVGGLGTEPVPSQPGCCGGPSCVDSHPFARPESAQVGPGSSCYCHSPFPLSLPLSLYSVRTLVPLQPGTSPCSSLHTHQCPLFPCPCLPSPALPEVAGGDGHTHTTRP